MPDELRRWQKISAQSDGSFRLSWIVQGEKGAIEYHHDTDAEPKGLAGSFAQTGFPGVETHSHTPRWDGHRPLDFPCTILCGECYCDGSSLDGEDLRPLANYKDFETLWAALEKRYRETFGEPAA